MSKRIVICNPHHERICSSTTYWFLDLFDALWCGDNAGIEQAKLDSSIRIDNGVKSQLTFTICCCYERDSFFLRIARGGLPIPNKENWHSSFGQRPRRDELFFNIFWTFSGVPVGCSSSGKSALHSIQSTIWSVLWRIGKTYCPLIFIYTKNGWKSAQISVAFVIVLLVVARQKSTALSKIHHAILCGKSLCHIYITSH